MSRVSKLALGAFASIVGSALLVAATVSVTSVPAQAKKCFAEALGLPCKKCHINPAGGREDGWNAYGQKFKAKGNFPC